MRIFIATIVFILIFAGPTNAAVIIESVSVSPNPIYQGETAIATVTVTASGASASNVAVTIGYPSGLSVIGPETQIIASIPAGGSRSVSWTVKGELASSEPYTLTFTVSGANATANASLSVLVPPFIEVLNQSCFPTNINVGHILTMSFTLKNTGGGPTNVLVDIDYNSECFSLVSGLDPWSLDINAGAQITIVYDFEGINACTGTITARISSAYNDPNDYSCTITVSTTPEATPSPTQTQTPVPTSELVPVTGGFAPGTTPTPSPTATVTPTLTPSPETAPEKGLRRVEKLLEKIIDKRMLAPEIREVLGIMGASDAEIKGAIRALTKVRINRIIKVEKIVDANGKTSFKTTVTLELENTAGIKLRNLKVIEVIPKVVLERIDANMVESNLLFEIIEADPVLRFSVPELDANETLKVHYVIKSDINRDATEHWKAPFVVSFREAPVNLCEGVVCESKLCKKARCDPATGKCVYENLPDGTACGDNKECRNGECIAIVMEGERKAEFPWVFVLIAVLIIIAAGVIFYTYKRKEAGKTPLERAVHKAHKEAEAMRERSP